MSFVIIVVIFAYNLPILDRSFIYVRAKLYWRRASTMTANHEKDYDQLAKELQSEHQDLIATLESLKEYEKQIYKTISTNRDQMRKLTAARSNGVGNQPTPPMPVVQRALNVGGGTVVRPKNQYQMSQLLQQQQQQTTVRPVANTSTSITMRPVANTSTSITMRPVANTSTPTTMTQKVKTYKKSTLEVTTATGPTLKLQPVSLDFIKKMMAEKLQATTNKQQADSISTQNPKRKANNGADIKLGRQITITKLPVGSKKVKLDPTNIVSNNYIPILPKPTPTSDLKIVEVTGSGKMGDTDSQTVEKIDRRKTKLAVDPADMLCNPIKSEPDGSDIEILEEFSSENNANNSIKVKTEATAETVEPKNVDKPSKSPQNGNN